MLRAEEQLQLHQMMVPPGAPLLDSACCIPALLEAEELAGETVIRAGYGACLQHEFCWASLSLQKIFKQTSTPRSHWHETLVAPRQPDTKYTVTKYI
jgi:hypothetical protein